MPDNAAHTIRIEKSYLLIVEGKDEEKLFSELARKVGLQDKIQTFPLEGKGNLAGRLGAVFLTPRQDTDIEIVSVGIVVDADTNAEKTFRAVCKAVKGANLPVPSTPLQTSEKTPHITIATLPIDQPAGMLEDICLESVAETDTMRCVDDYFGCLSAKKRSLPKNMSKARVQAFLAGQKDVGLGVGIAAQKQFWNLDHPAFDPLKNFLRQITDI